MLVLDLKEGNVKFCRWSVRDSDSCKALIILGKSAFINCPTNSNCGITCNKNSSCASANI